MRPTNIVTIVGAAAALGLAPFAAQAAQEGDGTGVEAGVLTCSTDQDSKINLLVHSKVDVSCVFETAAGKVEHYSGETGIGAGLDLSWDTKQKISFTVLSGGTDIRAGQYSLAGNYVGGKASVAAGLTYLDLDADRRADGAQPKQTGQAAE